MGPLLAIFLVLSANLAPSQAASITIDSYVVEGVGYSSEANRFLLSPLEGGGWLIHDVHGAPWLEIAVDRSTLSISDPRSGGTDAIDLAAALGVADEDWWADGTLAPPEAEPLFFTYLPSGVDVTLEGVRVAEIRW